MSLEMPDEVEPFHEARSSGSRMKSCPRIDSSELPVCFQDEGDRLLEVLPGLLQGGALRIGPGKLLNETDVPLGDFLEDCGQLQAHAGQHTRITWPATLLSPVSLT